MAKLGDIIRKEFEIYAVDNHQKPDIRYLTSDLVLKYVRKITSKDYMLSIIDEEIVKKIYQEVLVDVENINAHQNYSAAVLHYRKFLSLKISVKK